jgi:hypothetical protein
VTRTFNKLKLHSSTVTIKVIRPINNPVFHVRTKHIEIHHHFIRKWVQNKYGKVVYCRTEYQLANIFKKVLNREKFQTFREMLDVKEKNLIKGGVKNLMSIFSRPPYSVKISRVKCRKV